MYKMKIVARIWDKEKKDYVDQELVDAMSVRFINKANDRDWIEVNENTNKNYRGDGIVVRAIHGSLVVRPQVANVVTVEVAQRDDN